MRIWQFHWRGWPNRYNWPHWLIDGWWWIGRRVYDTDNLVIRKSNWYLYFGPLCFSGHAVHPWRTPDE